MSFALLYSLVRFLLDALLTRRQSELRLRAEVLAVRHQLRVLERQVRRPCWQPADRLLVTVLSRVLPRPAWSVLLVSPETLLRWHRELIRGKWAAYARRSPHSDRARPSELHQLILRLARGEPTLGVPPDPRRTPEAGLPLLGAWVVQQARRLAWLLQDGKVRARFLLRDRDAKFAASFDEVFSEAWR
jgi:hypothetical protein